MSWLEQLIDDLVTEHRAVAAILYGSRARGGEHAASDVDVMLLVHQNEGRTRDTRKVMGPDGVEVDVDAWLKPIAQIMGGLLHGGEHAAAQGLASSPQADSALWPKCKRPSEGADTQLLHLRGGRVMRDHEGVAAALLARLDALYARGPEPLPDDERAALRVWGQRMLARIARRDDLDPTARATARWRQAELLVEILPDVYLLRGWWYPGPGPALRELATRAPDIHERFIAALAPDASLATLTDLVHCVLE